MHSNSPMTSSGSSTYAVDIVPSSVHGTVHLPASKSLSHRALICAGLAQGQTSRLRGLSRSQDIAATIFNLRQMGAVITESPDEVQVTGINPACIQTPLALNANESGSTLRFFIPLAALGSEPVTFAGKPTLLSRPMGIYADLFLRQNLPFHQSGESITFHGPLQGGLFEIPGDISSQFISGLLFALPTMSEGGAIAVLPPYESRSYVDLTLQMMERFGIHIEQPTQESYIVSAGQSYKSCDLSVEGDYSQLAFFGVLGALKAPLTIANIARDSLQGDRVILSMLEQAGAHLQWNPAGDALQVSPAHPVPQVMDLANCPDLGPILCVLAAYTPGTTRLIHARRLRYKESDRIAAMEAELRKWKVDITSDEDSITIQGRSSYAMDQRVVIDGHNDHRIVMAMTIFGLCAQTPSTIEGAQAIAKSYPAFFADLQALGADVRVIPDDTDHTEDTL